MGSQFLAECLIFSKTFTAYMFVIKIFSSREMLCYFLSNEYIFITVSRKPCIIWRWVEKPTLSKQLQQTVPYY